MYVENIAHNYSFFIQIKHVFITPFCSVLYDAESNIIRLAGSLYPNVPVLCMSDWMAPNNQLSPEERQFYRDRACEEHVKVSSEVEV